jgi:PAS domain S-box-containing protein
MAEALDGIVEHRTRIVDRVLVVIAWLAVPTYLLNLALSLRAGELLIAGVGTAAFVAVIAVAWLRDRLPLGFKAWFLPVTCFLIGLVLQVRFGPQVGGWVWLAAFPVMAAVLIGFRAALTALGLTLVALVAIGIALATGRLDWPAAAAGQVTLWLAASANFLVLAGVMSLPVSYLLRSLSQETAARQVVEDERARLALVVEQSPVMVAMTDRAGVVGYTNGAFQRITGWETGQTAGHPLAGLELLPGDSGAAARAALVAGEPWQGNAVVRRRDGTELAAELVVAPLRDDSGEVTHQVLTLRDISREADLARQLQQTQKLEAIGTLAGGIAHDFNNLLLPILANADQAARELPEDHPARRPMEDVAHSARRATELVRRILAFSRGGAPDRRPLDLVAVVHAAGQLLRSSLPSSMTLRLELPDTPLLVLANESELHQVVMNLATNAWHAMRAKGQGVLALRVALATAAADARLAERGLAGEWIRLEVVDTGTGMTPEVLARAFDPFFTTKPVGEGTGLGLATVHGSVLAMGGVLVINTVPGEGTTVAVYLQPTLASRAEGDQPGDAHPVHGRRILAVDDEPLVLRALERLCGRLGHSVTAVADPREALAAFGQHPETWDLLFTDLTMPGMTGVELARAVHRIRPELPVVLATGYLEAEARSTAEDAGIRQVIVKPFSVDELGRVLQHALARGQGATGT